MSTVTGTQPRGGRSLVQRGLLAVVLSSVANAVLLAIARSLELAPGFRPFEWAPVLLLSFVPDVRLLSTDENATVLGVVVLMVMHVTVAAICVALLTDRGLSA